MTDRKTRIGIVGYGRLGQYLTKKILANPELELAFVWNKTKDRLRSELQSDYILEELDDFNMRHPDIVVEVADPCITRSHGTKFLRSAKYVMGSTTALVDDKLRQELLNCSELHGLYLPVGALWGAQDIRKMAERKSLQKVRIEMTFHPDSLKLKDELRNKVSSVDKVILYSGPVRQLCYKAPNNTNTIATAAMAAHNLGFDHVEGCLISDPSLIDCHLIVVEVWGEGDMENNSTFHVTSTRRNPAQLGGVTGSQTNESFYSSLLAACKLDKGVHLC